MSVIKVEDLAYVRFGAPDLDRMEAFLADFGLERTLRTESIALRARRGRRSLRARDRV